MDIDLKKLLEFAQEATPGPWEWVVKTEEFSTVQPRLLSITGDSVCDFGDTEDHYPAAGTEPNHADRAFIEAVNPAAIIALTDTVSTLVHDYSDMAERLKIANANVTSLAETVERLTAEKLEIDEELRKELRKQIRFDIQIDNPWMRAISDAWCRNGIRRMSEDPKQVVSDLIAEAKSK